jgi:hypothetical protein
VLADWRLPDADDDNVSHVFLMLRSA